jgi:hypothetical protein
VHNPASLPRPPPIAHRIFGDPIDPETPCRGLRRGPAGMPGNQRRDPLGSTSDYLPLEYVCTHLFGLTYLLVYVLKCQAAGTTHTEGRAAHGTTPTRAHDGHPRKAGLLEGASLGLCYIFYLHHCIFGCSQAVNTKCLQRYPAVDLLFCPPTTPW